jgi:D-glycero-D-manno-heptose 1,7-bisphosphate phosphatase
MLLPEGTMEKPEPDDETGGACGTKLRRAVFLDRDGTIIEDRGDLSHPSQVVFFRETVYSLRRLCEEFDLYIVTNQSGVAKGAISIQDVERVNSHVVSHLAESGVRIVETYVCPHRDGDGCCCIKPNPYFLRKAEKDHSIDLKHSYVIGDHPHDVAFAANAGASGIYVLSGHGRKHRKEISGDTVVVAGIREAAEIIFARGKQYK